MKKVLLLTGALLGVSALASCGKPQAKDVDLSIKEMDDKFKLPSDLLTVDSSYAEFAVNSARTNLTNPTADTIDAVVPRKTVFEEVSNVNAAVNAGKLLDYVPGQWGQSIDVMTKTNSIDIPIDTTDAYKYNYIESLTLFDDLDLTEYTINANRRYATRDGGELNYKSTEALYNFWPLKDETTGKYSIQNYVKENKSHEEGTFDYKTIAANNKTLEEVKALIKSGVADTAANMYMYILNGGPSKTKVPESVPDRSAPAEEIVLMNQIKFEANKGMKKNNQYANQYKFYISKDYNSIYLFQSRLTGSNYVFPSSSSSSSSKHLAGIPSFNDIIPVYSVENMVAKVSRFDKGLTDWRVDYVGMYGKTYATKDDNLVTFDKPRCISSEYWYTSSTYDKISGGVIPEVKETQEYKTKENLDEVFNGFAGGIYSYDWDQDNKLLPNYDLDSPKHKVSYLLSDIRGVKEETILDPSKPISLIAGGFDFSLSDKTMGTKDLKENQYLFSGIWDPSSAVEINSTKSKGEPGHAYGRGMVLKALAPGQTTIETYDILNGNNDNSFMKQGDLNVYNIDSAGYLMIAEGLYYDEGSGNDIQFDSVISGARITSGAFDIDIVLELTNGGVDITSVTLTEIENSPAAEEEALSK